jgi:galactokinase
VTRVLESLRAIGLSASAAEDKAELFDRALAALASLYSGLAKGGDSLADARSFWTPGRVEFLGKHTDYAGGRSLLCAIERGICIVASPRRDTTLRVVDACLGETVETTIDSSVVAPPGHWSTYPLTVARRIARDFGGDAPLVGADIAFASDLPPASGMSSSSALVVATFLALADVNRLAERAEYRTAFPTLERLAGYLGAVENGYSYAAFAGDTGVGTFGGSEDHTAILCARPASLVQYSFCPVRFERAIPLPADHELVLAYSGVTAEKIGAVRERYNRLSRATQELAAHWHDVTGRDDATLGDAVASSPDAAERMLTMVRQGKADLHDRLTQFVAESTELIPRAGDALLRGDLRALGALVDRSQDGAERLLRNQVDETIWLVREARTLGAVAASAFGAGFGGAVWALVPTVGANAFRATWAERYAARFPTVAPHAKFFATYAGPPAARL